MNGQRPLRHFVLTGLMVLAGLLASIFVVSFLAAAGVEGSGTSSPQGGAAYDWMGEGNAASASYGESVRSAGDVNGDNFDDVIVGAVNCNNSSYPQSGRAYLYDGSANGISTTAGWDAPPPVLNAYGFFGGLASTAGDVNGDGYDDVLVTMTNYDNTYADEGAVFVWYGSNTGLKAGYDWVARGNTTYAHLGWDAGPAGDVNHDGYDDIIAGAFRYDSGSVSHAYVWYGSINGLNVGGIRPVGLPSNADWTATTDQHCGGGGTACSAFGTRVGSAGDVNADTYDDVFVGASRYDNGQTDEGTVFVWYGSSTGLGSAGTPSNADWKAESNQAGAQLGGRWNSWDSCGIDSAGDVNHDGYDDLVMGAHLYDNPSADEGVAFLWYGSAGGLNGGVDGTPGNAGWTVESDQASAHLGGEVSTAGDFNGDGFDDVLVGAPYFDVTAGTTITNAGQIMIWFGSPSGLGPDATPADADWYAYGDQVSSLYGFALDSAGDVNLDGISDVIVGARLYDHPDVDEGAAFAYYGVEAIAGLIAFNDSPTTWGWPTTFTAVITAGVNVTYSWNFGDDFLGGGRVVSHTYAFPGVYTATVTAVNPVSHMAAQTTVEIHSRLYLPFVVKP